jgi:glutamine synthetase
LKPLIAVPTTAGTGSEVTLVAVVKDHERHLKMAFVSYFLLPDVSILDSRMTLSLPAAITAATGMDALTHAVEAYYCLSKNPLSDATALAAIRLISSDEQSTRLEMRVPGADCNPYLAMAASLASGLYGIRNDLKLEIPESCGNAYEESKATRLPDSLADATHIMRKSAIARELFGDFFVEHFVSTREWECREFARTVTSWELKRYFEII